MFAQEVHQMLPALPALLQVRVVQLLLDQVPGQLSLRSAQCGVTNVRRMQSGVIAAHLVDERAMVEQNPHRLHSLTMVAEESIHLKPLAACQSTPSPGGLTKAPCEIRNSTNAAQSPLHAAPFNAVLPHSSFYVRHMLVDQRHHHVQSTILVPTCEVQLVLKHQSSVELLPPPQPAQQSFLWFLPEVFLDSGDFEVVHRSQLLGDGGQCIPQRTLNMKNGRTVEAGMSVREGSFSCAACTRGSAFSAARKKALPLDRHRERWLRQQSGLDDVQSTVGLRSAGFASRVVSTMCKARWVCGALASPAEW
eukprot:CAMPEP_0173185792 /NCGR_PEP_ID=MMETSP1141-20130122/9761_1 /TAXON_ID=483371 /ORGANISM="non described non described, Strain CCMP2298" /LENGTH=306 /DNA_ID=CAMNT_0014109379 /DNA_START=340 /DNA_END=1259 /DNA_ORIENTATION=-